MPQNLINWGELIKFTGSGLSVAEYSQIRIALANRYKEIYGEDIDLSTGSADGIFIETYSLIVNNILQSFKTFYSQLDVNTATGQYLDILCALSNVYRKSPTKSTATLVITLDESETTQTNITSLTFSDINGNTWEFNDTLNPLTLEPGVAQTIRVTASELGPIRANAGWINQVVDTDLLIGVVQETSAEPGTYSETDAELRARRNNSLGVNGVTVLGSLAGSLLALNGVRDAKIYNNDTITSITAKDGTSINPHCVYVILRRNANIDIPDSSIGSLIYEKMTPGIMTTVSNGTEGTNHSYQYKQYISGVIETGVNQTVNWKVATPVKPVIEITLTKEENFATANNSTANYVGNAIMNYLNSLPLSTDIKIRNLINECEYNDPKFRGRKTFDVASITIDDVATDFVNQDTYYDYSVIDIDDNTSTVIITLS